MSIARCASPANLQAGTVWVNDWVVMRDEFEEGGSNQSGRGRLRGLAALDDFLEYKHIILQPGVVTPRATAGEQERGRAQRLDS